MSGGDWQILSRTGLSGYGVAFEFQSTHPQGCDEQEIIAAKARAVSIHAPARVRPIGPPRAPSAPAFQSTHPQGCDRRRPDQIRQLGVSIHAPARVRRGRWTSISAADVFQSTHPQGCDYLMRHKHTSPFVSIHAPARVRRVPDGRHARAGAGFNPRTRKGATPTRRLSVISARVSIHAPARVRHSDIDAGTALAVFQSTHPQGCDPCAGPGRKSACCFNPRTRKGATNKEAYLYTEEQFQSTHPQGCDVM